VSEDVDAEQLFPGEFDHEFAVGPEPGNGAFFGRNVLRGLISGIDDFVRREQPRWRQFRSLGPIVLGSAMWIDDAELIGKLGELTGACIASRIDEPPNTTAQPASEPAAICRALGGLASCETPIVDRARSRYGMRSRPARSVERMGVRRASGVFEDAGMAVQEIDGSNDIGKDLYVDLAEDDGRFTGELIALQIKSGKSYTRAQGYAIPCDVHHASLWTTSTVPVFGVVFDPACNELFWVNLTEYLRTFGDVESLTSIPVPDANTLSAGTLDVFLREARAFLHANRYPDAFAITDGNPQEQLSTISDLFAIGRRNAAPLLFLRTLLEDLDDAPFDAAIAVLALCAGHGDIHWSPKIWLDENVRARVRRSMNWTYDELVRLLAAPEPEDWERGRPGQNVAALVECDWSPQRRKMLETIVVREDERSAWPALMLLVTHADTAALALYERLVPSSRSLRGHQAATELRAVLRTHGFVSLW
jgi:hypothetical protein